MEPHVARGGRLRISESTIGFLNLTVDGRNPAPSGMYLNPDCKYWDKLLTSTGA